MVASAPLSQPAWSARSSGPLPFRSQVAPNDRRSVDVEVHGDVETVGGLVQAPRPRLLGLYGLLISMRQTYDAGRWWIDSDLRQRLFQVNSPHADWPVRRVASFGPGLQDVPDLARLARAAFTEAAKTVISWCLGHVSDNGGVASQAAVWDPMVPEVRGIAASFSPPGLPRGAVSDRRKRCWAATTALLSSSRSTTDMMRHSSYNLRAGLWPPCQAEPRRQESS